MREDGPLLTPCFAGLFAGAAIAGFGILQVVGRLHPPRRPPGQEYFLTWPLEGALTTGGAVVAALGGLLLLGFTCGVVHPRGAWILGAATVLLIPVAIVIEGTLDDTAHNLLPFELVFDGLFALPGILGAVAGAEVGRSLDEGPGRDPTATRREQ